MKGMEGPKKPKEQQGSLDFESKPFEEYTYEERVALAAFVRGKKDKELSRGQREFRDRMMESDREDDQPQYRH